MSSALLDNVYERIRQAGIKPTRVKRERRVATRHSLRQLTRLYVTHRPLSAVIVDVSVSGIRFITRMPWDVGSVVGLSVTVDDQIMTLPVLVLWDRWEDGHFESGGCFVALTAAEKKHIARYVEHVHGELGPATYSLEATSLLTRRELQ